MYILPHFRGVFFSTNCRYQLDTLHSRLREQTCTNCWSGSITPFNSSPSEVRLGPVVPVFWSQSSPMAIWEDRGENGVRQTWGRSPASSPSPSQPRVFWRSLRTESQRGGEEAFGAIDMMGQCLHVDMSSKYVRAALPAAAVFSFPVAAFVDVELLTRDAVLAAIKPTGLVVVVRHAWKKRTRY